MPRRYQQTQGWAPERSGLEAAAACVWREKASVSTSSPRAPTSDEKEDSLGGIASLRLSAKASIHLRWQRTSLLLLLVRFS